MRSYFQRTAPHGPGLPIGFAALAGCGIAIIAALAPWAFSTVLASAGFAAFVAAAAAVAGRRAEARMRAERDRKLTAQLSAILRSASENGSGESQDVPDDLEAAIRATGRAYQSLEIERKASQELLERRIAGQADYHARLSHELRSPLNAILGYTSLLIEDIEEGTPADLTGDLQKIRGAGHTLLNLIDSLLQLAQDRNSTTALERAPFLVDDVLEDIVKLRREAGSKVQMEIAASGKQTIFGNQAKFERAITSLFDDAIRTCEAVRVVVSNRASAAVPGHTEVTLDVTCAPSAKPKEDTVTLSRHLAERLAEAIGGRLEIARGEIADWRYSLHVPFDTGRTLDDGAKARSDTAPVETDGDRKHQKSALIVDDDVATIELMGRWLERSGYVVTSAQNAEEGLSMARSTKPDIVLLDALMPGRSGYDILPDMAALPELGDTPILMVTVDDDRLRGLKAGASDFVRKPITEGRLRDILSVYEGQIEGDVLIIEDDPATAELLERTARKVGLATRLARDGAEGLAAMRQSTPSAVLLDLQMPRVSGFEVIEAIAADAALAAVPIIVFSGQELTIKQHHALVEAGCRYHMKGNAAPRDIAVSLREAVS